MNRRQRQKKTPPPRQIVKQALAILGSYSVSLPLVAAFAALFLMLLQASSNHQRVEQVTNLLAREQSERMAQALNSLRNQVSNLARSSALQSTSDIASTEKTLQQLVPEADSLTLVPLGPMGIADKDNTAVNALQTHIERDMLRRASETGDTVIDAFQHQRAWLIGFAHPVTDFGVLLVRFPADFFKGLLLQQLEGEAQVQLVAQYRNQARPIINIAIDNPSDVTAIKRLPVADWHIRITPSQALLDEFSEQNVPLLAVILVCILIAILNVLVSARHAVALNKAQQAELDQQTLERQRREQELHSAFASSAAAPSEEELPVPEVSASPFDILEKQKPESDEQPQLTLAGTSRQELEQHSGSIFRAYDIRGVADTQLDDETCRQLGQAIGSEVLDLGHREVLIGRDGRNSSPRIHGALVSALRQTGLDVVDLGLLPTPLLQFACFHLDIDCGVMVTGSHNAPDNNGLKIVMDRQALSENAIQALKQRIDSGRLHQADTEGSYREVDVSDAYVQRIVDDIALAQSVRVVVDAGNGATGNIAPRLFTALGCRVEPLFCDIDGNFPNHTPDPTIEDNLEALKTAIRQKRAHLGFAFDGDGDRLVAVTAKGHMLASDQLMMILAQDVISRNPGCQILYDVKCSRLLARQVSAQGGVPVMWKSGHSFMKRKMAESGALFGGEFSGHLFYNERWYGFDDGMYAAARLLEILSLQNASLDGLLSELPTSFNTPEILVPVDGDRKFAIVEEFRRHRELGGTVTDLDGVRVDYADGWGLVRASNTGPALTLRFEADSQQSLDRIIKNFTEVLSSIDSDLAIGF